MSQQTPSIMDVTDLQFKLQHKLNIFNNQNSARDNSNLLASASTRGVVFIGGYDTSLLVCPLAALADRNVIEEKLPHFKLQLPSAPHQIALSCDDAYLAIDVEINRNFFVLIYSVESIINQQPKILEQIKLASEDNVRSKQILWNPVQNNILAILLDNGAMSSYVLQEKGFQFNSLDKAEQTQCACWSPKGKQIVVGCRNGKIVQYKPDLKPARIIQCPPGTYGNSFQTIAIQWLSTYQFATVFLSDESPDATPALHIVNAPKAGQPAIRNYSDICYSAPGPRRAQVFLIHLSQWNILLVASANSMEVGILGTNENGDFPTWSQWITSDEARAELPLTDDKDDTFPIGFCLETGCTHNVLQGESKLPIMPMIHMLSTHGIFVSFNVVNLKPTYVDICSPPRPLPDGIRWEIGVRKPKPIENLNTSELSFTAPTSQPIFQTSTPASEKSFFTPNEPPKSIASNLFGNITPKPNILSEQNTVSMMPPSSQPAFALSNLKPTPQFGTPFQNVLGGGPPKPPAIVPNQPKMHQAPPPSVQPNQPLPTKPVQKVTKPAEPIIHVQPTYNKSMVMPDKLNQASTVPTTVAVLDKSDDATITPLITEEINNFERELKDLLNRTKNGKELESNEKFFTTEYKNMVDTLIKLQDTMNQAMEATETLKTDVHSVRLSLNESFAMQAEAQSKHNIYNDPDYILLHENAGKNQTNLKQLSKLKSMLKSNEVQFNEIYKTVYSQYSIYEDIKKKHNRDRMKIPSLPLIHQSISQQTDLIQRQRKALNVIKKKIGLNSSVITTASNNFDESTTTMESLTDSIISLSIADRIKDENSRLSFTKKKNLQDYLKNREVVIVKPSRPENEFLISKIINGRKIMKENQLKTENETKAKGAIKVETKQLLKQKILSQQPKTGMVPLGPSGPQVYKPSPITGAIHDAQTQLPKFTGFSTTPAQNVEIPSAVNVDRKKKEQKTPPVLPASPSLVFSGSTGGFDNTFNFAPPISTASAVPVKKSEPDTISITTPSSLFGSHNQKPSPNFGFGGMPSLSFGNVNANKDMSKPQEMKTVPVNQNIQSNLTPQMFAPKPVEMPKPTVPIKLTLQEVSSSDTKTITSLPSGVDFTLGSGLSITKLSEKPAAIPQSSLSFSFKQPSIQDKPISEKKDALAISSTEGKPVDSTVKPLQSLSEPTKLSNTSSPQSNFQTISPITSTVASSQAGLDNITPSTLTSTTSFSTTATTTTVTAVTSMVPPAAVVVTTSSMPFSFGMGTGSSFSFANAFASKTSTEASAADTSIENVFQGINVCKPTVTATSSTPNPENIFASAISNFEGLSTTTTANTTKSIFGGQTTITATTAPLFGTVPPNITVTTAGPTPAITTVISNAAATTPFGGLNLMTPKTETNVFGGFSSTPTTATETLTAPNVFQSSTNSNAFGSGASIFSGISAATTQPSQVPPTNLFGSALSFGSDLNSSNAGSTPSAFAVKPADTTATASPFGGNTSIFGGATSNTGASTPFGFAPATSNSSSIFGGAASGGSMFGGMATTAAQPSASVFGSPVNTNAASGGSLFGSGFGSSAPNTGSIFGGSTVTVDAQSSQFPFAQKSATGSVFASPSAFGQTTPSAFNSPASGAFSATPQQAPAFGSPSSFGGASAFGSTSPTFGGPATFGAMPTFGGTATFMSPTKGSAFGAFGAAATTTQPQSQPFGGAPQQQNTLFEQLGSSDNSGISFGNLAQNANNNPNKQQPFGGTAFMAWR